VTESGGDTHTDVVRGDVAMAAAFFIWEETMCETGMGALSRLPMWRAGCRRSSS
jgi:hypothetical protein